MRVGVDIQHLLGGPRSGIFFYIWNLLAGLQAVMRGEPRIALFVQSRTGEGFKEQVDEVRRAFPTLPIRSFRTPGWAYNLRVRFSHLGRLDVLHHTHCLRLPALIRGANVFTISDLSTVHFPAFHTEDNRRAMAALFQDAAKFGDIILTYSEHTKQDIVRTLALPEDRIGVTPLAAGEQFRPMRDRREVLSRLHRLGLDDKPYILTVGTLEPRKNHGTLIKAFGRLLERNPQLPHKLVLAGSKGWFFQPVLDTIARLGLEGRVVVLGHADHLDALYNGADLMVYPSLYEGFGLPPLEAMACGTPVITSNRASLPEVVGDAAFMVDPENEEVLAETMEQILNDQALQSALREKGLRRAASFSWQRTARETLAGYALAHQLFRG